jgi:hypothetical protein
MGGATLAAAIAGTTGGAGAGVFDFSEGSGTVTIPTGATGVTIEVWGGGGGGGFGTVTQIFGEFLYEPQDNPGGGGGSGGYAKTILVLSGGDALKTIAYAVGAAGTNGTAGDPVGGSGGISTASAGTYALAEMVCTGGGGGAGGIGFNASKQGAGGIATGGNTTNTNGNGGANFTQTGGAAVLGVGNLVGGAGGNGGDPVEGGDLGKLGSKGRVRFKFTIP